MIKQLYKSTLVPGAENTPIYPVTKIGAVVNLQETLNNNNALLQAAQEALRTVQNKVDTIENKQDKQQSIYSISNDNYPIIKGGSSLNPIFKLSPSQGVQILNPETANTAFRASYQENYRDVVEMMTKYGGKITLRDTSDDHECNPYVEITTPDDWHLNISPGRVALGGTFNFLIDDDDETRISLDNDNGGNIALYEDKIELALGDPRISIKKDGDLTLKNPQNNNILISDLRRMILYHPNGNQFIHSNPEKVTKNGEEAEDWFTIKYPNGQTLFKSESNLEAIQGKDEGQLHYYFRDEEGRPIIEASRLYSSDEGEMILYWTPTYNHMIYGNYYPNDEESSFYIQYPTGQTFIDASQEADETWFNLYTYRGDSIIYSEYIPSERHDNYNLRDKRTTQYYNTGNLIMEDTYYEYDDKQDSYYDVFRKYIYYPNESTFIEAVQNEPDKEHYLRLYYPNGTTLFAKEGTPEESEDVQLITKGEVKKNLQVYSFPYLTATTDGVSIASSANVLISKNWETDPFIIPEQGILTLYAEFAGRNPNVANTDFICHIYLNEVQTRFVRVHTEGSTQIHISFQEILEVNQGDKIDLKLESESDTLDIYDNSRVSCKIEKY